jgi:two-component sensor histidine kinase/ligand-binding sensor domain-containing protein
VKLILKHNNSLNKLYFRVALYAIILHVFCAPLSYAQQYDFRSFSLEDGLSQSEVNCIFQDSRGYIWAGTSGGGLCRFDGKEFTSYETENGLAGQIITDIKEDKKGNLWISSTWGGISKFDGKTFTIFDHTKGLPDNYTSSILISNDGKVYVGTGDGLCCLQNNRFVKIKQSRKEKLVVSDLLQDKFGNIWVGSSAGLFKVKNNEVVAPFNATKESISSLDIDKSNRLNILLGANKLLLQEVGKDGALSKALDITHVLPKLNEDKYFGVYIDNLNRRWLTTFESGVVCEEGNEYFLYNTKSGLPTNRIIAVYQDNSGCLWFGSRGSGLVKFKDRSFEYFDEFEGLNDGEAFSLQPDSSGNLWIGTLTNGLYKFDGKKVVSFKDNALFKKFNFRSICLLRNKKILIGGSRGVRLYDGKNFSLLPGIPDEPRIKASVIYEDKNGDIWIGTFGQGLFMYSKGVLKNISNFKEGHVLNIYSICETENDLLIGTGDGVYTANAGSFRQNSMKENLCNYFIGSMVKDHIGRVWIGTDKCIAMWDGKKINNYGVEDGFTSGTVYSIVCDKQGNIWVGTNKGIDKVSFNADGSILQIKNYGFNEGFKGVECNSRSICMDRYGNLYFGTIKGVIKYNVSLELPQVNFPTKVQIESFKVNFNDYSDATNEYIDYWYRTPKNPKLPHNIERISFSYSSINRAYRAKLKYSFMLEGYDTKWSPWVTSTSASYSSLSPGSYTFKVKAQTNNKVESKIVEFPLVIKTPFYLSFWFIISSIFILIYLYYLYIKLRKAKAKNDLEALEKVISERTFEIQKQSEEKEILLKEIHHRVKNNLQVINSLINIQSSYVEDEKALSIFEECKNRIRTIALIHEKLYKSNDFKKINFNDYIVLLIQDLVQTYNVDKEIELKTDLQIEYFNLNTLVPLGLLLNEIVSNSLKYAFENVDKGIINITLLENGFNQFELVIGDNGKGYDGEPNNPNKSTLGLELIKILTEQLDGNIVKLNIPGTVYKLDFKLQKN